jgi:NADH-quinone oxidoreductase subunit M
MTLGHCALFCKKKLMSPAFVFRTRILGVFLMLQLICFNGLVLSDLIRTSIFWLLMRGVLFSGLLSGIFEGKNKLWWAIFLTLLFSFRAVAFLVFYILFELRLIPILMILLFYGSQPERLSASLYLLMYTLFFSLPFIVLALLILSSQNLLVRSSIISRNLLFVIIIIPFLVKIPVFGAHFWLPKAHVEASTSGSIVLARLLLKLGRYGLVRLVLQFKVIVLAGKRIRFWLMAALLARIITILQSDGKKLVAYSRITHITFIIVGLISFRRKSCVLVVILLSLAHGWASRTIFARAGIIRKRGGSRLIQTFKRERNNYWGLLLLGLALVNNAAIPPTPAFFPELKLVFSLKRLTPQISFFFLLVSLRVCYYNLVLFLLTNGPKNGPLFPRKFSYREGFVLKGLSLITLLRLGFVAIVWRA